MTDTNHDEILQRAHALVVVDDGFYRWVGDQSDVYGWLKANGFDRDYTGSTSNSIEMNGEDYLEFCDSVECITCTDGVSGRIRCAPNTLIDDLLDRGAATLTIT